MVNNQEDSPRKERCMLQQVWNRNLWKKRPFYQSIKAYIHTWNLLNEQCKGQSCLVNSAQVRWWAAHEIMTKKWDLPWQIHSEDTGSAPSPPNPPDWGVQSRCQRVWRIWIVFVRMALVMGRDQKRGQWHVVGISKWDGANRKFGHISGASMHHHSYIPWTATNSTTSVTQYLPHPYFLNHPPHLLLRPPHLPISPPISPGCLLFLQPNSALCPHLPLTPHQSMNSCIILTLLPLMPNLACCALVDASQEKPSPPSLEA